MPNKKEAAAVAAEIVERHKRDLVKKAVAAMRQRGGSETTPPPDRFPSRIGSKHVFRNFNADMFGGNTDLKVGQDAPFDARSIDESGLYKLSSTGARESISQQKYFIYVFSLVYFYIESNSKGVRGSLREGHFETPEGLVNHNISLALQYLRKKYSSFYDIDFSDTPGSVDPTTEIIYISSFPDDEISEMTDEIENKLESMGFSRQAAKSVAAFPHKMSDKSSNGRQSFFEKLCHEFTHRYVRKSYDMQGMKSQTVEEAFAWFTGIYLDNGLDFEHSAGRYEDYNEPETIKWMIDFLRETVKLENPDNVIDWTRKKGKDLIGNHYSLAGDDRVEFVQYMLPRYSERASRLDRICQGELDSLVKEFEKELQKLKSGGGPEHDDVEAKVDEMDEHLNEFDLPDDFEEYVVGKLMREMIEKDWDIPKFMKKFDEAVEKERKELEILVNDLKTLAELLSHHGKLSQYPEIKNIAIEASSVEKDLKKLEY